LKSQEELQPFSVPKHSKGASPVAHTFAEFAPQECFSLSHLSLGYQMEAALLSLLQFQFFPQNAKFRSFSIANFIQLRCKPIEINTKKAL